MQQSIPQHTQYCAPKDPGVKRGGVKRGGVKRHRGLTSAITMYIMQTSHISSRQPAVLLQPTLFTHRALPKKGLTKKYSECLPLLHTQCAPQHALRYSPEDATNNYHTHDAHEGPLFICSSHPPCV
eukprot:scaffold104222_cov24-Tisochrysis_lutea.AAC.2